MTKGDDNFDPFEFFDEKEAEAIDQEEKKKAQDEALTGGSQVGEIKDPVVTAEEVSRENANFENDEKEQALAAKERHIIEQAAEKAAAEKAAAEKAAAEKAAAEKAAADQAAADQAAARKRAEEQLASEKAAIAQVAVEKAAAEQAANDVKEQLAAQQKALEQMAAQQAAKQKALDEMAVQQAVKQRELDNAERKKGPPPIPGNSDLPQSPSSRLTRQGSGAPATPPPLPGQSPPPPPRQSNEKLSEGNSEANDAKPSLFDNEPNPAKINRNLFNK